MDTKLLQQFIHLCDTLHFGKAAALSYVSPSALSRSIKSIEEQAGVRLVERDNREVRLTREGVLFRDYAKETLHHWERFRTSLQHETKILRGSLSLFCSVTASYSFLYEILSEFRQDYPGIELKIHTGDPAIGIERVLDGIDDIAIVAKPETSPEQIAFKEVAHSPLVFIGEKHQFRSIRHFDDDFWQSTPMIVSEVGLARDRLNRWLKRKRIKPNIYAQVAGHEAIVSMVSLGFGVGVVPDIVLNNSPLKNSVEVLDTPESLGHYNVCLCTQKKRIKSPIIGAFWKQNITHLSTEDE
ncbi:HTH-type transcriptional activator IlvY [Marinibactrum halimedae]|uniref:Transcriptional regulator IlvY n=1 Tax=Marinibactrum halimedae TaxID=1444977 RepID=A0AA37WNX7_9GAMM|nr:HTH-type transcriptional activator IlvY [Marinibactrum halimedae]MCD9458828.1 HTH-type transcriptional activator IlvY [Marinibactrum halimedae]GLS25387.1 transcriptional regulator IlvY [Marinibactrum halimedae]